MRLPSLPLPSGEGWGEGPWGRGVAHGHAASRSPSPSPLPEGEGMRRKPHPRSPQAFSPFNLDSRKSRCQKACRAESQRLGRRRPGGGGWEQVCFSRMSHNNDTWRRLVCQPGEPTTPAAHKQAAHGGIAQGDRAFGEAGVQDQLGGISNAPSRGFPCPREGKLMRLGTARGAPRTLPLPSGEGWGEGPRGRGVAHGHRSSPSPSPCPLPKGEGKPGLSSWHCLSIPIARGA